MQTPVATREDKYRVEHCQLPDSSNCKKMSITQQFANTIINTLTQEGIIQCHLQYQVSTKAER
jgi:hypothetical protein